MFEIFYSKLLEIGHQHMVNYIWARLSSSRIPDPQQLTFKNLNGTKTKIAVMMAASL